MDRFEPAVTLPDTDLMLLKAKEICRAADEMARDAARQGDPAYHMYLTYLETIAELGLIPESAVTACRERCNTLYHTATTSQTEATQ